MSEGGGVAHGGSDGDGEQVADTSHVAAGGVNLGEDAVLSQGLGAEPCSVPGELLGDRDEPWRADPADEEVGVDAGRPGPVAVVEPGAEAYTYRASQGDVPAGEVEAGGTGMAAIAESLAEVTVSGGAFAAGRRGERPARQALVTEVDPSEGDGFRGIPPEDAGAGG